MAGFIDIVTNDTDENGVTTQRRIHLNNPDGIFHIREWKPLAPPPEDLFQFSPFEDGRVLAMRKYGNMADEFTMDASSPSGTMTDQELQALRAILKKAVDYWIVDWQMEPVWIEMMGDGETNTRYSYIYAWDIPEESNPFANPRNECPSLIPEWPLRIEHGFWMDSLSGTCVELSATQDYYDASDGIYVPTESADDCYVDSGAASINLNANNLLFGRAGAALYSSGVRFRSVDIPQGAIIFTAFVRLQAVVNLAGDNCIVSIRGDDVDDSAIFTTFINFNGRARTAAAVAWNPVPHFVAATNYDTPDLSAILNEIVARPGWAANNSLSILFDNNGSTDGAYRSVYSWDDATHPEPILYAFWYDTTTKAFGHTATCDPIYFSDRHNKAQLTHAYYYDTSVGTYSANLISAVLPTALFPAVPGVGDILYLICATGIPDSGPFGSAVFDLSIVDAGMTGAWEYWNGAWIAIPIMSDFTTGFRNLGINDVNWKQPLDWTTTTVNAITGYMVRFRVTAVGAGRPTQQNRNIYAVVTPFVDIDSTQVGGDLAMLALIKMYERTILTGPQIFTCSKFVAGLRKRKRGLNFTPYINLSDEQNPAGITIGTGLGAFANDTSSETGRAINWNSASTNFELCGEITFAGTIAREYQGSFMVYLRTRNDDDSSHYSFKFLFQSGSNILYESPVCTPEATVGVSTDRITITALGELTFPFDPINAPAGFRVLIYAKVDNIARNSYLHTFIMMPNDEWIGQYDAQSIYNLLSYDQYLAVDPISQIKLSDVATIRDISDGYTYHFWDDKSPHFPRLHELDKQRLWLFHPAAYNNYREAYCSHIGKIEIDALKKYFGSWG